MMIVMESHERVMHSGVKATLTELRSRYWIVEARNYVRRILRNCVTCQRHQGKPYKPPPAPPLPAFRVNEARPFSHTGVDFAGPLYVRDTVNSTPRKVWMCLFTCCVTRAVHLELVPDMTTEAFIRCFRCFSARRGFPVRMVSDNAKTFKAAAKTITSVVSDVADHLSRRHVTWIFNLERAPWWGGLFERMIQTTKRCLKKVLGNARLTYDELLTSLAEVEMTLNSRPLTYVSSDDLEEPLTPSHLLCGFCVLSLPDPPIPTEDDSYSPISISKLTRRVRHLKKALADFWRRWRLEYLLELREAHRYYPPPKGVEGRIHEGDVVLVHEENLPRGLWRLGRIEGIEPGADGNIRAATVRVAAKGRNTLLIKRPIQRLYQLEFSNQEAADVSEQVDRPHLEVTTPISQSTENSKSDQALRQQTDEAPRRRQAFHEAQERVRVWCKDLNTD